MTGVLGKLCRHAAVLTLAALVAVAVGASASSSATGATARPPADRIVLISNRDGTRRGYTVASDGSRLTRLLRPNRSLIPAAVSGDGRTIAYLDPRFDSAVGIYVSRADGSGLHRIVAGAAYAPALSRDGRLLAFTKAQRGIWVVRTDGRAHDRRLTRRRDAFPQWSPDGRAVAFFHAFGPFTNAVVVQPLHGPRRIVGWSLSSGGPRWSPDGRWIAYENEGELWLVRPNGAQRHRVASGAGESFAWAPVGERLAFTASGDVVIVGTDGRNRRRLHARGLYVANVAWSPEGRRLAFGSGYPTQIWLMGVDGRGLHRVTNEGSNNLLGWTRLAPLLPPARQVPRTERVIGRNTLTARAQIFHLAADAGRAAFFAGSTKTDCDHVAIWTPTRKSVARFGLPSPCVDISNREGLPALTLAGTRAAWVHTTGGNTLEQYVLTATLQHPTVVEIASAFAFGDASYGTFIDGLAGDGALLVFSIQRRCSTYQEDDDACPPGRRDGEIVAATIYRVGGAGPCPFDRRKPRACTPVAHSNGPLTVLAVDSGRIAVGTETGVRLLTSAGGTLRDFTVKADAAALSGNRLAVRTSDAVEVYDTGSGRPVARFPAPRAVTLEDLEGGILVTAAGSTITLWRLGDGRTAAIETSGRAHAQLEAPGLFVAGTRRITFTPMAEILGRLGD